jgi:hypothetical protein
MSAHTCTTDRLGAAARVGTLSLALMLLAMFALPAATADAAGVLDTLRKGSGPKDTRVHRSGGGGGYYVGGAGNDILFWYLVFGAFYQPREYEYPDAPYEDGHYGYLRFTGRWDPHGYHYPPEGVEIVDTPLDPAHAVGWETGYQNYDFSDQLGFENVTGLAFHAKMRAANGVGFTYDYLHLREFDNNDVEIDRLSLTHGTFDIGLIKSPNVLWDIGLGWGQINGSGLSGPCFGTSVAIFPFKPISVGWKWTATGLSDDDPSSTTSSTIFDRTWWVGVHLGKVEIRWSWREVDVDTTQGLLRSSGFGVTIWF